MKKIEDFNNIEYKRLDYDDTKKVVNKLINNLKESNSFSKYLENFKQIINLQNKIEQLADYADIRNMRNSADEYYQQEVEFWQNNKGKFDLLFNPFYELCLNSPYNKELEPFLPPNFFLSITYELKTKSAKIKDLQKRENALKSKYRKLMNEEIIYDGQKTNLTALSGLYTNEDRVIRKKAYDAVNDFFYKYQEELDDILYELVNIRKQQAKILNFQDYSEYSLYFLRRFGYNYEDIKTFRNSVRQYMTPLIEKLEKIKKINLGVEHLEYFDAEYNGSIPQLKTFGQELLNEITQNLNKMDSQSYEFISKILTKNYIDLENRNGKVNFSITNYLTESALPVITGNYKNNYKDVTTTAHEFGHALQKYYASLEDEHHLISPILKYPTFEIAEMFSQALELILMRYNNSLFSQEDYQKFNYLQLASLISKIVNCCMGDEFQERIYTEKNIQKMDLRRIWKETCQKYDQSTFRNDHINLITGGDLYKISHFIYNPFYYIDYALAFFGAFAIAENCQTDLNLFKQIGKVASYYPLPDLIAKYNLPSPFEEKNIEKMARTLNEKIDQYCLRK